MEPAAFAAIVDWLLSGNIGCYKAHKPVEPADEAHFFQWRGIHAFAERFQSEQLGEAVICRMRASLRFSGSLPGPGGIQNIFHPSTANQRLHNLVAG